MNKLISKNKSICFVIDVWFPVLGGGQERIFNLANKLAKKNIRIAILTRNFGKFREKLHPKINLVQLGDKQKFAFFLSRLKFLIQTIRWLKKNSSQFDLIDFQPFSPWLIALFFKKKAVITILGRGESVIGVSKFLQPVLRLLENFLLTKISWRLIISDTHQAVKSISKSPIQIVPNGINSKVFENIEIKKDPNKLVFLGRFHYQKGIDILLSAFREVIKKYPKNKLVLIGDGDLKPVIIKQIKQQKLQTNVELVGFLTGKKMIKELKSSACFVLSSRWEGQPISIFLAMAAKLPVITTNVADNHHYIKPNVNGYLVSTENPIGFAKAIIKIIQNPIKAKRMGQLNYQIVKNNYTWDIVAQKVWRIYKKLI